MRPGKAQAASISADHTLAVYRQAAITGSSAFADDDGSAVPDLKFLRSERGLDRLERSVGLGAVGAAALGHVRLAAAALATKDFHALADQVDSVEPAGQ